MYDLFIDSFFKLTAREKKLLYINTKEEELLYNGKKSDILSKKIISEEKCDYIIEERKKIDIKKEYDSMIKKGIRLINFTDCDYPKNLSCLKGMPFSLYVKGNLREDMSLFAIVGARRCSEYGRYITKELASSLLGVGFGIISGMALGIDGEAHKAAIKERGYTIAILGSGVDVIYPKEHEKMYEDIISSGGAVISEYIPGTNPKKTNFPERNRIISALSDGVLVIEAAKRSGSLITADFANSQGKSVYAVPGRCTDYLSSGTNELISDGAGIIVSKEHFLRELGEFFPGKLHIENSAKKALIVGSEERLVYSCLDFYGTGTDEICKKTKLPLLSVLNALIELSKKGLCRECFINQYVKIV